MRDPYSRNAKYGNAMHGQAEPLPDAPGADFLGRIEALDRAHAGYNWRLRCLELAHERPDGASPPQLAEVIERARSYWAFIQKGE